MVLLQTLLDYADVSQSMATRYAAADQRLSARLRFIRPPPPPSPFFFLIIVACIDRVGQSGIDQCLHCPNIAAPLHIHVGKADEVPIVTQGKLG